VIHGARNRATTDPRSWVVAICIIAPTLTVFLRLLQQSHGNG